MARLAASTIKGQEMQTRSQLSLSATQSFEYDDSDAARDTRPGKASRYYQSFGRLVRRAAKDGITELLVVLYVRVSSGKQFRAGNSDHQLASLSRRVHRIGAKYGVAINIIRPFDEGDVSAWKLWASGRPGLAKAAKRARKKGAVLVALNTSRLVRNKDFQRYRSVPTVDDFERLMAMVGDVRLATVFHPDQHEDRASDSKRGWAARGAKPGRPRRKHAGDKKRRRMQFKLPVIRLFKQGLGNREISRKLELPEKTVRDWRARYRRYLGASFSETGHQETCV